MVKAANNHDWVGVEDVVDKFVELETRQREYEEQQDEHRHDDRGLRPAVSHALGDGYRTR